MPRPSRTPLLILALLAAGCVAPPSTSSPPPGVDAEPPADEVWPTGFEIDSALTQAAPSAVGPDATITVRWNTLPDDAWMQLDGEPAAFRVEGNAMVVQAQFEPGPHQVLVGVGFRQWIHHFTVTTPCGWIDDHVAVELDVQAGEVPVATLRWPTADVGATVTDAILTLEEDGAAMGQSDASAPGTRVATADAIAIAGREYGATASLTCDGEPLTPRSVHHAEPLDCAGLERALQLTLAQQGDTLHAAASWPAGWGDRPVALSLREWTPWDDTGLGDGTVLGRTDQTTLAATATPNAQYMAELEVTCGTEPLQLRSPVVRAADGAVMADLGDLAGTVFAANGTAFRVVAPSNAGSYADVLHMKWLPMLAIDGVDGDAVAARIVWAHPRAPGPEQRPCSETVELPLGTLTDGVMHLGPTDLEVLTARGSARVYDLEIEAAVTAAGTGLEDLTMDGRFDMRDLYEEMGFTSVENFCLGAYYQGTPCRPCPDGAYACMDVTIDGIDGYRAAVQPEERFCPLLGDLAVFPDDGADYFATTSLGDTSVRGLNADGTLRWEHVSQCPVTDLWLDDGSTSTTDETFPGYGVGAGFDCRRFGLVGLVFDMAFGSNWANDLINSGSSGSSSSSSWSSSGTYTGSSRVSSCSTAGAPSGLWAALPLLLLVRRRSDGRR